MFIQFIHGPCTRRDDLRALLDRWRSELSAGAAGWLGGTYGFTDDGLFLAVVRFESRAAAQANSDRPEQGEWAEELRSLIDGPLEFHDSDDVTLLLDGGSDQAGFVQVIRGRAGDPARLKAMMADSAMIQENRPDILGATLALEPDGAFTETIGFTSEADARAGEQQGPPAEIREVLQDVMQGATFYDLRDPWFDTA